MKPYARLSPGLSTKQQPWSWRILCLALGHFTRIVLAVSTGLLCDRQLPFFHCVTALPPFLLISFSTDLKNKVLQQIKSVRPWRRWSNQLTDHFKPNLIRNGGYLSEGNSSHDSTSSKEVFVSKMCTEVMENKDKNSQWLLVLLEICSINKPLKSTKVSMFTVRVLKANLLEGLSCHLT